MTRRADTLRAASPWLLLAALVVLLALLAGLQQRWLDRVAEADAERTRAAYRTAASNVARDLNAELMRLVLEIPPSPWRARAGRASSSDDTLTDDTDAALTDDTDEALQQLADGLADGVARWRQLTAYPDLLADVYLAEPASASASATATATASGAVVHRLEPRPSALDGVARTRFASVEPPEPVARLLESFAAGEPDPLADDLPGLAVPLPRIGPPPGGGLDESFGRRGRARRHRLAERLGDGLAGRIPPRLLVLRFDESVLLEQLLPELIERSFGADLEVHVRVVDREPQRLLATVGPPAPDDAVVDLAVELYGPFRGRGGEPGARRLQSLLAARGVGHGRWLLEVQHPAGSLAAAVAQARRRSTAIGLGVLLLLGTSAAFLAAAAARARRLAARQLDFVAAVTHELLTPLSALRSAGQNLAAGIIDEPAQVARYGDTIDREAARLSDTVRRVLAFAGTASGQRRWRPRSVDAATAIDAAIDALRPSLEAADARVVRDLPADLPPLVVDPEALDLALRNLLGNAMKYGRGADGALTIEVSARRAGRRLALRVADDGPGVAPRDRRDLFEPFTRGRGLAASAIAGSGLGLALVRDVAEAHGGRVRLLGATEHDRRGAAFELELPLAGPANEEPANGESP